MQVVLTEGAKAFVTDMTLQAISGKPVRSTLLDPNAEAGMGHIELAKWADLIVVAPASADFMARYAQGMANDLLTTLCLATEALVLLAPAMNQADVFIGAAAVADFKMKTVNNQKMKKQSDTDEMQLTLVKNPDIIATMVTEKLANFVVGFAAETQNVLAYAKDKLDKKGLDLIIANDVSRTDIGFNQDQNQVTVVAKDQTWTPEKAAKTELASYLVALIQSQYQRH